MSWIGEMWRRVGMLARGERFARELEEEMRTHREMKERELRDAGVNEEEARYAASRAFGNATALRERSSDSWGWRWLEDFAQDLRLAGRMLVKSPGFTIVAALTLGLGIALNATIFSMVSAFLLRRPPVREPERVVVISAVNPNPVFLPDAFPVSAPNYLAWREANHVFADVGAANESGSVSLTGQGQPEILRSAEVTPNYFSVLGVSPKLGRAFVDGEGHRGQNHVVILSHDLWERRFGSDPAIVQGTIRLNRENYNVLGVMPANFQLLGFTPQLWTPLVLNEADQTADARQQRFLQMFARLKAGVTLEQAQAEITALGRRAEESFPEVEKGWGTAVRTLPDFLVHAFAIRGALAVMMAAVGFVLMLACANVAGLLLARTAGRRNEMAIRVSLGASGLRIVRQFLTEGLLLALIGGGIGVLLAYWSVPFFRSKLSFNEAIRAVPLQLDGNVLLFALGVSVFSAVLCGLAPALKAARADVNASLKDGSRAASVGRSQSRLRTVLVAGEVALALFLLIGTGLLTRGLFLVEHQKLGFQAEPLLTADLKLDQAQYKDGSKQSLFVSNLLARLRAIPGVEAIAAASDLPATGPDSVNFLIKGQPELPAGQQLSALDVVVTAEYFRTAGIPLVRGRTFTEMDNPTAPRVVLVNQEFVHRHFKDGEALGRQIRLNVGGTTPQWSEIVGVVGNVKTYSEETRDDPEIYEAFLQRPVPSFSLMVRSSSDPNGLAPAVREAVGKIDAELPLARVMSMPTLIERQRGGGPFLARALGSFAILALILAGIGIYGLVAFSVGQRTHEIGMRMALGARSRDVQRMILWQGTKMTGIGAAIGLAMAVPLPKVFDAAFYGLHVREPLLYLIVPVVILAVAALATYVPARRATRVDPMTALRME
jgi:putative ABC transport system permease protein